MSQSARTPKFDGVFLTAQLLAMHGYVTVLCCFVLPVCRPAAAGSRPATATATIHARKSVKSCLFPLQRASAAAAASTLAAIFVCQLIYMLHCVLVCHRVLAAHARARPGHVYPYPRSGDV
jgi:hypothetical protein